MFDKMSDLNVSIEISIFIAIQQPSLKKSYSTSSKKRFNILIKVSINSDGRSQEIAISLGLSTFATLVV